MLLALEAVDTLDRLSDRTMVGGPVAGMTALVTPRACGRPIGLLGLRALRRLLGLGGGRARGTISTW